MAAEEVAARLADAADRGLGARLVVLARPVPRLGYTGKSVRIGFIHYNSPEEVDRLTRALNGLRLSRDLAR